MSLFRKNSMNTDLVISNFHLEGVGTWLWGIIFPATRSSTRWPSISLQKIERLIWYMQKMQNQKPVSITSNTSARTSLISCSALSICSGVPESSTGLVCAPGSASLSLVTWILAPDWSWRYLIVSPAFPIITPTYSKLTVSANGIRNITIQVTLSSMYKFSYWNQIEESLPFHLVFQSFCLYPDIHHHHMKSIVAHCSVKIMEGQKTHDLIQKPLVFKIHLQPSEFMAFIDVWNAK